MTGESHPSTFEYDVALSFASEHKATAEELAGLLFGRNRKVFLDEFTGSEPWGRDVLDHLVNLYARKAHYCVLFLSQAYPLKSWTEAERTSAQERALRDSQEYIVPLRVDDSQLPGLTDTSGPWDLRLHSLEDFSKFLEQKLAAMETRAGPPTKSHDLRSGNVPSKEELDG
jgi:hypothetical protein